MLTVGRDNLHVPAAAAIDKVRQPSTGPMADMAAERLAWPALLRKLDRMDPVSVNRLIFASKT